MAGPVTPNMCQTMSKPAAVATTLPTAIDTHAMQQRRRFLEVFFCNSSLHFMFPMTELFTDLA